MKIHLVDGTYELFRSFYGPPPKKSPGGREVGATIGLLRSMLALISDTGATHIACAFDHVVESFRNDLFAGYKTGAGINPDLRAQFSLAEQAVAALGIVVWPMVEFEADDAIATAAVRFQDDPAVDQVIICSPDKDLAQVVSGNSVVCWDRRRGIVYDEAAVIEKYGVGPASIPDWLALVGDSADGIPGIPAWGAKSAATLLSQFQHIEAIPDDTGQWGVSAGRARRLAQNLNAQREDALLYRRLATLSTDVPLAEGLDDLEWRGARPGLKQLCVKLGANDIPDRIPRWIAESVPPGQGYGRKGLAGRKQMIGQHKRDLTVVPYRSGWLERFKQEAGLLQRALGEKAQRIEHIGSTAVPGMAAKPIIDIMVAVDSLTQTAEFVPTIEALGYQYKPLDTIPERIYFTKESSPEHRTHHLNLAEPGSGFWKNHLAFRDYLRAHDQIAAEYVNLKKHLAEVYAETQQIDIEGKSEFVARVLELAEKEGGNARSRGRSNHP